MIFTGFRLKTTDFGIAVAVAAAVGSMTSVGCGGSTVSVAIPSAAAAEVSGTENKFQNASVAVMEMAVIAI